MPDREKVIAGLTMLVDRKNDDTCEGLKCCNIAEDALALLKEQEEIIKESEEMAELFNDAVARCRKYMEKYGVIPIKLEQKKRFLVTEKGEWIPLDKDTDVPNKVVRCKDCKYGEVSIVPWSQNHYCKRQKLVHEPDWFCADGEQKEGG
jgi:hypothetical protein